MDSTTKDVVVRTANGAVRGLEIDGIARFRGIPYAAAPFGANRFRFPQPADAWDGTRDALVQTPGAPQPLFPDDALGYYFNPSVIGEDCLTVDVWTPDPATSGLPVMVWIHGGGFAVGTGSSRAHEGGTFARDGIVHVSLNYRLNIDGFTYLGEGTDNLGLRDMVAALEWVRDNIAAFGGDPDNVTIFGESGGAVGVMHLLAMPSARGLFIKAIAESGSPSVGTSVDEATTVTRSIARKLRIAPTREAFAALTVDQTVSKVMPIALDWFNMLKWGARSFTISPFRAVYGTESLPEPVLDAAPGSTVALLTGTNRNEAAGFVTIFGLDRGSRWPLSRLMLRLLKVDGPIRDAYRESRQITTLGRLVEASWTDWAFRMPTINLVERRTAPTHLYEFRWQSPSLPAGIGSEHALEIPFMRDDLDTIRGFGAQGAKLVAGAPQELATRMHRAWVDFATTGDPGWETYDLESRRTMVFDESSAVLNDPAAMERLAWKGKR